MRKVFFTSDTHFGSQHTLDASLRPFKSVEEMNETIVKNWNETVSPGDIVYHLGDFGDFNFAKRLNGEIIFIVGNHELNYFGDYEIRFKFNYLKNKYGFKEIHYNKYIKEDGLNLFLTHKPSNLSSKSDCFTLFGHLHRLCMIKTFGLNVGQDVHFFKPIPMETVRVYYEKIQRRYKKDIDILV